MQETETDTVIETTAIENQEQQEQADETTIDTSANVEEPTEEPSGLPLDENGDFVINTDDLLQPEEEVGEENEQEVADNQEEENANEQEVSEDTPEEVEIPAENAPTADFTPEPEQQTKELPEGVDKLVSFLEDNPGATLEDYNKLNRDLDTIDDESLIKEYYRTKYPRMKEERIKRKMDKEFGYDEDLDDEDLILDKKDAFEDATYEAKEYLNGQKEKYYSDLKLRKHEQLDPQTKQAVDYYQQQQKRVEENQKLTQVFTQRTEKVFNEDFKGFNFKVGTKERSISVKNPNQVKESQSDLNNFIRNYIGEDGSVVDAQKYHRDIWAASNADALAEHFYELGRAEAIKEKTAKAKNIKMDARSQRSKDNEFKDGPKVTIEDGGDSNKLSFKF